MKDKRLHCETHTGAVYRAKHRRIAMSLKARSFGLRVCTPTYFVHVHLDSHEFVILMNYDLKQRNAIGACETALRTVAAAGII